MERWLVLRKLPPTQSGVWSLAFVARVLRTLITYLALQAGKMKYKILCSDWLPEQARGSES